MHQVSRGYDEVTAKFMVQFLGIEHFKTLINLLSERVTGTSFEDIVVVDSTSKI